MHRRRHVLKVQSPIPKSKEQLLQEISDKLSIQIKGQEIMNNNLLKLFEKQLIKDVKQEVIQI